MPNLLSGTSTGSAPIAVSIGTSSVTGVVANSNRIGLTIVNVSDGTVYLGLDGNTAVLRAGIMLNPNGGSWVMDDYTYTKGVIAMIAHAATAIVAIQEFTG